MKTLIERRVVNLDKKEFDIIKKYCDLNALKMPKWLIKIALEKIQMPAVNNKDN